MTKVVYKYVKVCIYKSGKSAWAICINSTFSYVYTEWIVGGNGFTFLLQRILFVEAFIDYENQTNKV